MKGCEGEKKGNKGKGKGRGTVGKGEGNGVKAKGGFCFYILYTPYY